MRLAVKLQRWWTKGLTTQLGQMEGYVGVSRECCSRQKPCQRQETGVESQARTFFKQIKQTLQLGDFLGHNANAARWQVWTALLTYALLRYLSHLSKWAHSFTRLFTILRAALWEKYDLLKLPACYGTTGGDFRNLARPEQAYFPGHL